MKPVRKFLIAIGLVAVFGSPALAADEYPFSAARFAKVSAAHKPVLVDISASWCPVCKVQKSAIEHALLTNPAFTNLVILDVDFDNQKDAVRGFNATAQSTLIFFRDGKEKARLVGVTDPDVIDAMMHRIAD